LFAVPQRGISITPLSLTDFIEVQQAELISDPACFFSGSATDHGRGVGAIGAYPDRCGQGDCLRGITAAG